MPVKYKQRAAGIRDELLTFIELVDQHFPYQVNIAQDGGFRTDELRQAALYAAGKTRAKTLKETPHGRGCAVDLIVIIDGKIAPGTHRAWEELGKMGEDIGLEWGGRWKTLVDKPHFQIRGWKNARIS